MSKSLTYVEIDVPSFVPTTPESLQTFRFAMPTDYLPAEIDAIPSIDSVAFSPARLSLGKNLGVRASVKVSFRDHRHSFGADEYHQGTFFGKWRGRYGLRLRGREFRLIRGVLGQELASMDTRFYVIENVSGPTMDGTYTIEAKDILKLADEDRAQAPAISTSSLLGSIDSNASQITLSPAGIGDLDYAASGWVCLGGKEVVSFTRAADVMTITRAQFGTVAQGHSSGDRVQTVLRYAGDDVANIINDLLTNYAGVPASYIPLADWQAETSEHLGVIYAATITEPTSVRTLLSELIEQAALALWWDDRAQKVRLNVLREISTDSAVFDQDCIIENSLRVKDQPTKRISQIWTYYGQRDPTDSGANEDNYRAAAIDADLERETDYGSAEIKKVQARWIETQAAATRHNSIQLSRFRDPPRAFEFSLFTDQMVSPAAGYQIKWWGNQDHLGNELAAPIQITRVTRHADRLHIEAEEMLASGVIVLVNVVFLMDTSGAVLSWDVPASWNNADNSINVIAPGGDGISARGGGGGAFSSVSNVDLTSGPSALEYSVGGGGSQNDCWFGGASLAASIVGAEAGLNSGRGGRASEGIGVVRYSGGTPSSNIKGSGNVGGGGAGGPHGNGGGAGGVTSGERGGSGGGGADGGEGSSSVKNPSGTNGGDNRFSFGGGHEGSPAGSGEEGGGAAGGDSGASGGRGGDGEKLWTQTISPIISAGPGGGGGAGGSGAQGGDGGQYGGGGGGSDQNPSKGGDGVIILTWREAA